MRRLLRIALVGSAVGLLAACSHEPLDEAPPPPPGELGSGPGLFSGADGGFYLSGGPRKEKKYSY